MVVSRHMANKLTEVIGGNGDAREEFLCLLSNYSHSRYLEFQGTLWNTSRYPYLDISDLQNLGKNESNSHI